VFLGGWRDKEAIFTVVAKGGGGVTVVAQGGVTVVAKGAEGVEERYVFTFYNGDKINYISKLLRQNAEIHNCALRSIMSSTRSVTWKLPLH
jgi:hypothetical protein